MIPVRLRTAGALVVCAAGALLAVSAGAEEPKPKKPEPTPAEVKRTPLVELFTSQG